MGADSEMPGTAAARLGHGTASLCHQAGGQDSLPLGHGLVSCQGRMLGTVPLCLAEVLLHLEAAPCALGPPPVAEFVIYRQ